MAIRLVGWKPCGCVRHWRGSLEAPIYAARAWLQGRRAQDVADLEGVAAQESPQGNSKGRLALRWNGSEGGEVIQPQAIRPGDTLILPATYGDSTATAGVRMVVSRLWIWLISARWKVVRRTLCGWFRG